MPGKFLLVFTFIVSVLLAGVSIVAFFAVPGMRPAMAELKDYSFEEQIGENITWSVSRRLGDGGTVVSGATEFEAVIRAREDRVRSLRDQASELQTRHAEVLRQLELFEAQQQQDLEALARSIEEKQALVASYENEVRKISLDFQNLSVQARDTRDRAASRREDVERLRAELEELRTDMYRLRELQRVLTDRLLRIRLDQQRLQTRKEQIMQQVTGEQ